MHFRSDVIFERRDKANANGTLLTDYTRKLYFLTRCRFWLREDKAAKSHIFWRIDRQTSAA
jgi:hypothetical protein